MSVFFILCPLCRWLLSHCSVSLLRRTMLCCPCVSAAVISMMRIKCVVLVLSSNCVRIDAHFSLTWADFSFYAHLNVDTFVNLWLEQTTASIRILAMFMLIFYFLWIFLVKIMNWCSSYLFWNLWVTWWHLPNNCILPIDIQIIFVSKFINF